ncbi:hypothetical protein AZI85_03165 [Bdellovibrio bacteriovorus]|uniref:Uncharacterized protein n=1 Tax=Bdellovibrio bacteriovorus TaxID=959 RepID=A0A150WKK9_BDEBC|nr:hypothetical protein AZI85_03165 [Bdellovibrio bacteriovorus]
MARRGPGLGLQSLRAARVLAHRRRPLGRFAHPAPAKAALRAWVPKLAPSLPPQICAGIPFLLSKKIPEFFFGWFLFLGNEASFPVFFRWGGGLIGFQRVFGVLWP